MHHISSIEQLFGKSTNISSLVSQSACEELIGIKDVLCVV